MYNAHNYLSCIKMPAAKQSTSTNEQKSKKTDPMDFAANHHNLVSAANRVFGDGKWNHTVVSQTLDYVETIGAKCYVGCVSFVKVQLENGSFHEDIGYYSTEESTKGLSIHNARIGSTLNALKRVLLSFGSDIERELQQLEKPIIPEQTNDAQKNIVQLDNAQTQEKLNIQLPCVSNPYIPQVERKSPEPNQDTDLINIINTKHPLPTRTENSKIIVQSSEREKIAVIALIHDKIDVKNEQNPKQALSANEVQRMERKRKQMEKQMEFKKRMMEKEGQISNDNNKPNPKY